MNTREQLGVNDPLSTIALIERNLAAQEHPNRLDWWHRILLRGSKQSTE